MSAETKIIVEVHKIAKEIIEVNAVTLDEAMQLASREAGVINVIRAYYPDDEYNGASLAECPNCFEAAWDGRICHICGCKEI